MGPLRLLALALAAVVLAGCNGGTVDRHALTNDASTIGSINCEGWLLARAVDRDRVTERYARSRPPRFTSGGESRRRAQHRDRPPPGSSAVRGLRRETQRGPRLAGWTGCTPSPPAARPLLPWLATVQGGGALLVSKVLGLALGILAAIGGFVDIGDLVFNVAAGATFGYQLLWVIVVGVIGIIVYSEMCGRVAAVSGKAVFDAVRERVGLHGRAGRADLVRAREPDDAGGRGRRRRDRAAASLRAALPLARSCSRFVGLAVVIWVTAFDWIERIFGYGGLCMLVFVVAAVKLGPDWGKVGRGFRPPPVAEQSRALCLLRGRPARRRDDAVRGLLLLVGRDRGPLVAEGSRTQPGERDRRLQPRRRSSRWR